MALPLKLPILSFPQRPSRHSAPRMTLNTLNTNASMASSTNTSVGDATINNRKLPIMLFDIMDTIVRDPFYHDIPAFFRMSMEELIECKHPTAWAEFEKGMIDEVELARKFFKDGRPFDLEGLKSCMKSRYSYIEGVEELLYSLRQNNFEMHAFTNYPTWYQMIDDKLNVSRYLSWTFCSCIYGKRKPDRDFYLDVLKHLEVDAADCIFIDDRKKNVEAAVEVGIVGLHFRNADTLLEDLSLAGIDVSTGEQNRSPNQA